MATDMGMAYFVRPESHALLWATEAVLF